MVDGPRGGRGGGALVSISRVWFEIRWWSAEGERDFPRSRSSLSVANLLLTKVQIQQHQIVRAVREEGFLQ